MVLDEYTHIWYAGVRKLGVKRRLFSSKIYYSFYSFFKPRTSQLFSPWIAEQAKDAVIRENRLLRRKET